MANARRISIVAIALAAVGVGSVFVLIPRYEQLTSGVLGEIDPAVSKDGAFLAYREIVSESPNTGVLKLLELKAERAPRTLLPGALYYGGASWSADSSWISYTAWQRLDPNTEFSELGVYKLNVFSQEKQLLVNAHEWPGIGEYTSWNTNGEIAFTIGSGLYTVSDHGGAPRKRCELPELVFAPQIEHLAWSPDGKSLAFSLESNGRETKGEPESSLWVIDVDTCKLSKLTQGHSDAGPTWIGTDKILFVRSDTGQMNYSLHSISVGDGEVSRERDDGIDFSPAYSLATGDLYFASSHEWRVSSDDFNLFRGFHLWRRSRPIDRVLAKIQQDEKP